MRAPRGQATTELALGALVFVVVLLFGIYFGEVPVMMLKVKEAANFSATHATGQRTHLFSRAAIGSGDTFRPFDPAKVGADTRDRYADLDGMSDRTGSSFAQVMTSADRVTVNCRADRRLSFPVRQVPRSKRATVPGGQAAYDAAFNTLRNRYLDRGGVACSVSADATPFRLPSSFVDVGSGKMSEEKLSRRTFKLCGTGRPTGNTCRGDLLVLTGDWGFDGPTASGINGDAESVQDGPVRNDAYAEFVEKLYEANGDSQGAAGRKLLRVVAGVKPSDPEYLDESRFNLSFSGDQGARNTVDVDRVTVDGPRLKYQTSGADMRSNYVQWTESTGRATGIPTCFLGLAGCAP